MNGFVLGIGNDVNIAVNPGDTITRNGAPGDGLVENRTGGLFPGAVVFNAPFVVPAGVTALGVITSFAAGSPLTITCTPAAAGAAAGAAGSAFINTQTGAIQSAVTRNTTGRLTGSAPVNRASGSGMFLSTANLPGAQGGFAQPELTAWISVEGRRLDGTTTGTAFDLVMGMDRRVSNRMIVGALVAYGKQDLTTGGTTTQINSPAVGGYFAMQLQGNWQADGYLALARPAYEVGAASFTASRVSTAFAISGNYAAYGLDISPFAKLNAYREAQPAYGSVAANDISRLNMSTGAKLAALTAGPGGVLPYISLAIDYGMTDSTAGARDTYWSPRVGAGFSTPLGSGQLSLDLDAGRVRSNVTDMGLRAAYKMQF